MAEDLIEAIQMAVSVAAPVAPERVAFDSEAAFVAARDAWREGLLEHAEATIGAVRRMVQARVAERWVPRELLSVTALRDAVEAEHSADPGVRRFEDVELAALHRVLDGVDPAVVVHGEESGEVLFSGRAGSAHLVLPPGTYSAVTDAGTLVRLVVGEVGCDHASAAFPGADADGRALDEIARQLRGGKATLRDVARTVSAAGRDVGAIGARPTDLGRSTSAEVLAELRHLAGERAAALATSRAEHDLSPMSSVRVPAL